MAVPTIGSVSPVSGPAGGRNLVVITGTNFRLPPAPPASGPTGEFAYPRVRVRINGELVRAIATCSATELRVEMPAYRGDVTSVPAADPLSAVAVEVANLDDVGVPIVGETITLAAGYTYLRPPQRAPRATLDNQRFLHVVREVVALFRRQVHPNAHLENVSTDFAESGAAVVYEAELPSVVLEGPRLLRDDWRTSHHVREVFNSATGRYDRFWPAWTQYLEFDVTMTSDRKGEAVALQQALIELFMRNGFVRVDKVPSDPSQGRDKFPFHLETYPTLQPGGDEANLFTVTAVVQVRGVDFDLSEPFATVEVVEAVIAEVQQEPLPSGATLEVLTL